MIPVRRPLIEARALDLVQGATIHAECARKGSRSVRRGGVISHSTATGEPIGTRRLVLTDPRWAAKGRAGDDASLRAFTLAALGELV